MNDRVQACYLIPTGPTGYPPAIADVVTAFGTPYMVTRINVPRAHQGRGLGHKLLNMIIADADREGVALRLSVMPYPTGLLGYRKLMAWYKRHGFTQDPGVPSGILTRHHRVLTAIPA